MNAAIAVGLAALALVACSPREEGAAVAAPSGGGSEEGATADAPDDASKPDFTLPDLRGNQVTLADYRGRVVVVDFWATWCPPCIFQVPELNAFWKAHQSAGDVMVIGVAVDVEGAETVGPWVEEQGVEYTILLGSEEIARDFGALGFPTLIVLAPDGTVDSLHVGLIEVAELEKIVAEARAG